MITSQDPRPVFERAGKFFPGIVQSAGTSTRKGRRRVLCFVTNNGTLGASARFSLYEAYENAMRAERGLTPLPAQGRTVAETITNLLKLRGFPVRSSNDELDDTAASALAREFAR